MARRQRGSAARARCPNDRSNNLQDFRYRCPSRQRRRHAVRMTIARDWRARRRGGDARGGNGARKTTSSRLSVCVERMPRETATYTCIRVLPCGKFPRFGQMKTSSRRILIRRYHTTFCVTSNFCAAIFFGLREHSFSNLSHLSTTAASTAASGVLGAPTSPLHEAMPSLGFPRLDSGRTGVSHEMNASSSM